MGVLVKNPTKKNIAVWWGHTPYVIGPGATEVLPEMVVRECLGHNDYKDLEIIERPKRAVVEEKSEENSKPWEAEDWDPMEAPIKEVDAYAAHKELIFDGMDEDARRDAVYELRME